MSREILDFHARPEPFARSTVTALWTDPHIAGRMLEAHLDPAGDRASRRPAAIASMVAWIDRHVGLAGKAVFDLGCGPGLYAVAEAHRGATVTGIDVSHRSIAHARGLAGGSGCAVDFRVADYLRDPLPGDQDLVQLIYGDLGALGPADRRALYRRVAAALRPDGRFVFDVASPERFRACREEAESGHRLMNGFWAPGDYFAISRRFRYDRLRLILDRYLVVRPGSIREYFDWTQCFEPTAISVELAAAGFEAERIVDAVTGAPWSGGSDMFAVVARRRRRPA